MGDASPNQRLWAGVVVVILGAVGYVYLRQIGSDEAGLMLFLGPFATALLIGSSQKAQLQKLSKIEHQTNGQLEREYRRGREDALAEVRAKDAEHASDPRRPDRL